jgi:6-pyruvoyl-tetrahydropterin synthase
MKQTRQQVRIFVRNATVLDCALWDSNYGPRGQSWQVDVEWHGHTDEEGVIVDFSLAKKTAKDLIDRLYDHRLFIAESSVFKTDNNSVICCPPAQLSNDNCFLIETYQESLSLLPEDTMLALSNGDTQLLESIIASEIKKNSPQNIQEIRVKLKPHENCTQPIHFNYLHSLRLHNGNCQRFHGHSNIVEVFEGGQFRPSAAADVAATLDGKYLVAENYLCASSTKASWQFFKFQEQCKLTPETHALIEYQGTQGAVTLLVPKQRLVLMPDESTIENISHWIFEHFFSHMSQVQVYGYEGLHKGAIYP